MEIGEAVVVGASEVTDGAQEVELSAVCPGSNFERLYVVLGQSRVAASVKRPRRGQRRRFKVRLRTAWRLDPGDNAVVEFFHPDERTGARWAGPSLVRLNPKPTTLRHPHVWRAL